MEMVTLLTSRAIFEYNLSWPTRSFPPKLSARIDLIYILRNMDVKNEVHDNEPANEDHHDKDSKSKR